MLSVRTYVPTFQNLAKQNKFQAKTMFTTGETVGLAEWIIDDTCLFVLFYSVLMVFDQSWFLMHILDHVRNHSRKFKDLSISKPD